MKKQLPDTVTVDGYIFARHEDSDGQYMKTNAWLHCTTPVELYVQPDPREEGGWGFEIIALNGDQYGGNSFNHPPIKTMRWAMREALRCLKLLNGTIQD